MVISDGFKTRFDGSALPPAAEGIFATAKNGVLGQKLPIRFGPAAGNCCDAPNVAVSVTEQTPDTGLLRT